jgi:hypothetical protein
MATNATNPQPNSVISSILNTTGIENFYNVAAANDFARNNLFRVMRIGDTRFTPDQLLYITTTTLPARAVTNVEVPFMGLRFNVPGTATYPGSGNWNVTFRVPSDLSVRYALEQWTNDVFNDQYSTGAYNIPSRDVSNQIEIYLLSKMGVPLRQYTLYGAWCQQVSELQLDITSTGDVLTQQAVLAYQFWRITG